MKKILELGCGRTPYFEKDADVIHLDRAKNLDHVEVAHNLDSYPYPFNDNEFDEIISSHAVEHIERFDLLLNELHRITKAGGKIKTTVPYFSHPSAFAPLHKNFFSIIGIEGIGKKYQEYEKPFNLLRFELRGNNPFFKIINWVSPRIYENVFAWLFPAYELYFELEVVK